MSSLIIPTVSETAKFTGVSLAGLQLPELKIPGSEPVQHDGGTYAKNAMGLLLPSR